jgi:predicted nucleotidyltransferase
MIIPKMGTSKGGSGLADVLFTPVQQRVLGLLFGQPDRRFQSAEIIRLANSGSGAVHRQLSRLEAAGLLSVTRSGNQKHYQARRDSPLFPELHGLVTKTVGLVEPLRHALDRYASGIRAAFVYGSIARGTDTAGSDIDMMVISDRLQYPEVFEALQIAESTLARPVHPTVMTTADWRAKRSRGDSFAARVAKQPKLFVMGSEDDIR